MVNAPTKLQPLTVMRLGDQAPPVGINLVFEHYERKRLETDNGRHNLDQYVEDHDGEGIEFATKALKIMSAKLKKRHRIDMDGITGTFLSLFIDAMGQFDVEIVDQFRCEWLP